MLTPQYITDSNGNKLSVVLPIAEYEKLLEELDELEDIRLYDEAKKTKEPSIPLEEAFPQIERNRKQNGL